MTDVNSRAYLDAGAKSKVDSGWIVASQWLVLWLKKCVESDRIKSFLIIDGEVLLQFGRDRCMRWGRGRGKGGERGGKVDPQSLYTTTTFLVEVARLYPTSRIQERQNLQSIACS